MCDNSYLIVEIILSGIASTGHINTSSAVFFSYLTVQTLHSCKGKNVRSIVFKYYLAALLVASRFLNFYFYFVLVFFVLDFVGGGVFF